MRNSRIKAKLRRQEPALVTTLHLNDPSLFEMVGLMGFDGIWLDLEHHAHSVETANELMRAARVGSTDIVARPAKGEFMRMARLLEAGAQAIMYPRCDNTAEAREVVRWAKFAPLGMRGIDTGNPDAPYCMMPLDKYIQKANDETLIIIQIEDPAALPYADEIARLDGVDVLLLGISDYSILCGVPGQYDHPKLQEAIRVVAKAAKDAGKDWGMPCLSIDHAPKLLELGARFIPFGCDLIFVKQGLEKIQKDFGKLGFTFDPQI